MQYITYVVTALTVVGSVANAAKKRWCFYIWAVTNLFWTIYNLSIKEYEQAIIYAVNFAISVFGLCNWSAMKTIKNLCEILALTGLGISAYGFIMWMFAPVGWRVVVSGVVAFLFFTVCQATAEGHIKKGEKK